MASATRAITLITGGGSGIGRATALRLASRGDHVVLADMSESGLGETSRAIREAGGRVETFQLDVRDRPAVRQMFAEVVRRLGGLAYVFSNAGVSTRSPVSATPLADWRRLIDTHVTGTFHVCQAALPYMVERNAGALVLTSSDFAIVGMRDQSAYAAAKTGLYSLTKALALEFAPHGIRVNAIGPGPIDTPLLRSNRSAEEYERMMPIWRARAPMQRLGRPEEVASVVDFLLSERAGFITGQLVHPNGGQVMW